MTHPSRPTDAPAPLQQSRSGEFPFPTELPAPGSEPRALVDAIGHLPQARPDAAYVARVLNAAALTPQQGRHLALAGGGSVAVLGDDSRLAIPFSSVLAGFAAGCVVCFLAVAALQVSQFGAAAAPSRATLVDSITIVADPMVYSLSQTVAAGDSVATERTR